MGVGRECEAGVGLSISALLSPYVLSWWDDSKSVPKGSGSPQKDRHLQDDAGDWCLDGGKAGSTPGKRRAP